MLHSSLVSMANSDMGTQTCCWLFCPAVSSRSAGGCPCATMQSSSAETSASHCTMDASFCWPHAPHSRRDQEQRQPLQEQQQQGVLLAGRRRRRNDSSSGSSRWRQMPQEQTREVMW